MMLDNKVLAGLEACKAVREDLSGLLPLELNEVPEFNTAAAEKVLEYYRGLAKKNKLVGCDCLACIGGDGLYYLYGHLGWLRFRTKDTLPERDCADLEQMLNTPGVLVTKVPEALAIVARVLK